MAAVATAATTDQRLRRDHGHRCAGAAVYVDVAVTVGNLSALRHGEAAHLVAACARLQVAVVAVAPTARYRACDTRELVGVGRATDGAVAIVPRTCRPSNRGDPAIRGAAVGVTKAHAATVACADARDLGGSGVAVV